MDKREAFQVLGVDETQDEKNIKNAYRSRLSVTNPEDDPDGFKRLRAAYEEACRFARDGGRDDVQDAVPEDDTPSGRWVERAALIYQNIRSRQDVRQWKSLFTDDCFISLEEEENCRIKLLRFLMDHFRLPTEVWVLLDKRLGFRKNTAKLREVLPADFVRYILNKCERGEDLEFSQFEGEEEAPYDLFLQYYDQCWQAIQENRLDQAAEYIRNAEALEIRHPALEICRASLLEKQGQTEDALELLGGLEEKYPGDAMICYNYAEMLWRLGDGDNGGYRDKAAEIYQELKAKNDSHYMANARLTEWYYDNRRFQEAKKCAEKVLAVGGGDDFIMMLGKVNAEIEGGLEDDWLEKGDVQAALDLCWCCLQDGKIARGIRLALELRKVLPQEKELEWNSLMAKLYLEEAEFGKALEMSFLWEESLKKTLLADESREKREKGQECVKQAHLIRMQCYHSLGFCDRKRFAEAIREGNAVLQGGQEDVGILLEMAQIYLEMEEYEKCEKIIRSLLEDYQIRAAHAAELELNRRLLNPAGVLRAGKRCIRFFPGYVKAYEYMAKVYLDLEQKEELERLLEEAEKNGVKSDVLEAYRFQMSNKTLEPEFLNDKLKDFRRELRRPVEAGMLSFYETGLPELTKLLYHCPDSYFFVERGIFHKAAQHYEEARKDFEKALQMKRSNPYALNGLSYVCRHQGDYEMALFYMKKAILYTGQKVSPVIYADMAELYAFLGDYETAVSLFGEYGKLAGDRDGGFAKKLAELYSCMGETDRACELYREIAGEDDFAMLESQVMSCVRAEAVQKAAGIMDEWKKGESSADRLRNSFRTVFRMENPRSDKIHFLGMWIALVSGDREAACREIRRLAPACNDVKCLGDGVFGAALCGEEESGRKLAERLAELLGQREASAENDSCERNKEWLGMQILSAWYTQTEEELQELLDREAECGICKDCVCAVCRELEGVKALLLLRQGKRAEAMRLLRGNLRMLPGDEYARAARAIAFQGDVTAAREEREKTF